MMGRVPILLNSVRLCICTVFAASRSLLSIPYPTEIPTRKMPEESLIRRFAHPQLRDHIGKLSREDTAAIHRGMYPVCSILPYSRRAPGAPGAPGTFFIQGEPRILCIQSILCASVAPVAAMFSTHLTLICCRVSMWSTYLACSTLKDLQEVLCMGCYMQQVE